MEENNEFQNQPFAKIALAIGILLVVGFTCYVLIMLRRERKAHPENHELNIDSFLTARRSQGWITIGWSLYASAVGSGVITAPAEIGYFGGILSLTVYAFAGALPILFLAVFSPIIHKEYPNVLSLSDFIRFKYKGRITQIFVVFVTLVNMSATIVAEYTTLASLYGDVVGLGDFSVFFILLVAISTLGYTSYGGLKASIITDRVQAFFSVCLVVIVLVYVAADFDKQDIINDQEEQNLTSFSDNFVLTDDVKGFSKSGFSTIFTLPLSLLAATTFSEAMWQRTWAAESDKSLRKASVMAAGLVFCLISTFGIMGMLVRWSGIIELDDIDDDFNFNLFAFFIFSDQRDSPVVSSPIAVLVIALATVLAQGALDSLQNGIEASISGAIASNFDDKTNLRLARVLLIVINIPLVIIGLQRFSVLSIFLFSNMLCVNAFFPLVVGFYKHPTLDQLHEDWIPVTVFMLSVVCVCIFAEVYFSGPFGSGIEYAFWGNSLYEYEYFLFSTCCSALLTVGIYFIQYRLKDTKSDNVIDDIGAKSYNEAESGSKPKV